MPCLSAAVEAKCETVEYFSSASAAFIPWGLFNVWVQNSLTESVQNLIALVLFRPLRLCVPAEQLRNARIILLRITHIPYVVAIRIYEGTHRFWSDKQVEWQRRIGSQKRSLLTNDKIFSHKAARYSAVRNRSEASLQAKPSGNGSRSQFAHNADAGAEFRKVLEKLDRQEEMIEKLSRQVEKLRGLHPPSPKA
ncbi:MAG: hypothetical protein Q9223_005049 [Gallowayella weberi]